MEIKLFLIMEATLLILLFVEDSRSRKWSKQLETLGSCWGGCGVDREKLVAVI